MDNLYETPPENRLSAATLAKRLLPELKGYHDRYSGLFRRREQREQSLKYLQGLLSDIPNKSVESMVLHREGDNMNEVRAAQQFISAGAWDDGEILYQHWQEVEQDLGDEQGVIIVDGSDFPKQGKDSVGVKRQWCGELGKVANCQAGVFLGYASHKGRTLLHRRLYMPEEWLADKAYAKRRQKCGVPLDLAFQTKPQLGLAMLQEIVAAGTLSYGWLTCDEAFGRDSAFLDQVAAHLVYFAEVPHDTQVWTRRPGTAVPPYSGRGGKPTKERLLPDAPAPETVATLAAAVPATAWSRHTVKEGSKGPIIADFACLRVVGVRHTLPGPDVWLVFRHQIGTNELKCYLSNAPVETPLKRFVWLSGMRWQVETCFEEGKQEIGLGDYQMRSWTGWHHHMTLCILAHFLLVRLQLRLKEDAPALTLPQAILLLQSILPKPEFDAALALDIVNYRQRRNHAAYCSHRKKRLEVSL